MGLFDRLRKKERAEPLSPESNVDDVLLRALLKGEQIDREKAMTVPAVSGAVDLIAGMIASMPVKLYKRNGKNIEEITDDPRTQMLNGDTQDTLNGYELKKNMVEDYLMGRGGYCYIDRARNDVRGLYYVDNIFIAVMRNFKPIYKDFVILVEGQQYYPWQFIRLLRNSKFGDEGIGLTLEVGKALETAYNTLIYQLGLVKNGGNKRGFLKSKNKLDKESMDALKIAWRNLYNNNEENVVILNNGLEFQEASNSSVEMQLDENKKTLQNEIDKIFHIHPDDFWVTFKEAIYPILKAFEAALNRDLLLEKEKGDCFFEFDVKEIVKANILERYQAYKLAKEGGFMLINEIRRNENLNEIPGLNVLNVGLGAVLYDADTEKYYTPNTDTATSLTDESIEKVIEDKEIDTAFEQSGNSAEG
ncbi:MAG: phage portal protein [Acutalibacteraceae bacterium]|nr:phage portal protein [Acutalibacteraceae bacterium]